MAVKIQSAGCRHFYVFTFLEHLIGGDSETLSSQVKLYLKSPTMADKLKPEQWNACNFLKTCRNLTIFTAHPT